MTIFYKKKKKRILKILTDYMGFTIQGGPLPMRQRSTP